MLDLEVSQPELGAASHVHVRLALDEGAAGILAVPLHANYLVAFQLGSTTRFRYFWLHSATATQRPSQCSPVSWVRSRHSTSSHVFTTRPAARRWPALRICYTLAPVAAPTLLVSFIAHW